MKDNEIYKDLLTKILNNCKFKDNDISLNYYIINKKIIDDIKSQLVSLNNYEYDDYDEEDEKIYDNNIEYSMCVI